MINKIINKKYFIYVLFIIVTIFFIIQHYKFVSWDFMAYTLNAKYFSGGGEYFEWVRPPLTPFIISLFGFFSWLLAEYLYIIFVSALHLFSCVVISKRFNFNPNYFYILSVSPFLLLSGLFVGTELLTLALLQFMIAYFEYSGIFLGLLFLVRYPTIILCPLILFLKSYRKIIKNILLFVVIISPWLLFNYFKTGNPVASILDIYAKDIKLKDYMIGPFNFLDILKVGLYLIPLFILGLIRKIKKLNRYDYIMLSILVLVILNYSTTPFKTARYLFLIILPLVYFSIIFIKDYKYGKHIILIILIFNLLYLPVLFPNMLQYNKQYHKALSYLPDNCIVSSNVWVPLNYYGKPSIFLQRKELLNFTLIEGYRAVIFYSVQEPDYSSNKTFLKQFPVIYEDKDFIILGYLDKCKENVKLDNTYLENLKETLLLLHGDEIDISTKFVLFGPSY